MHKYKEQIKLSLSLGDCPKTGHKCWRGGLCTRLQFVARGQALNTTHRLAAVAVHVIVCRNRSSWLPWKPRALLRGILIGYLSGCSKIAKKQYLLRFFLERFCYKTFVKIYLIRTEILSVINTRESGFSRILKSEGAIGCQRHGSGTQIVIGCQRH
jgi:hypothetical protein